MSTAASIYFPYTHYDIKYVQIQNISTTTVVLYDTFSPSVLCLYKNFKKLASTSNLCCVQIFPNTYRSKNTLVQPTESRELHTHRTIVDVKRNPRPQ